MFDVNRMAMKASGLCVAVLGSALLFGGCGGSDDPETTPATGGGGGATSSGGTGTVTTGGTTGTGGSESGGAGGFAPAECAHQQQASTTLIDFGGWLTGSWGDAATGNASGGSSLYQGTAASVPTHALDLAPVDPVYNFNATLAQGDYDGVAFWMQNCMDLSAYAGISLAVGGSVGGAAVRLQVRTNENYPAGRDVGKGACQGDYGTCLPGTYTVTAAELGTTLQLTWDMFTGGKPATTLDPTQITTIQIQFENCTTAEGCQIAATVSNITLIPK